MRTIAFAFYVRRSLFVIFVLFFMGGRGRDRMVVRCIDNYALIYEENTCNTAPNEHEQHRMTPV